MKCIKSSKFKLVKGEQVIVRVSDKEARDCVTSGRWMYTTKHCWKNHGRKYMKGGKLYAQNNK